MTRYLRPRTLDEALALRAGDAPLTVLAGGTDVYPVRTQRAAWFEPHNRDLLDLSLIPELAGIDHGPDGTRIGAMATWSAIAQADFPPAFDALKQASRQVGGVQIQNRATIGGNLCNASPAADGVPPLLALEAEVELAGPGGSRRLPLASFVLGNRKTALAPGELLVAIHLPTQPAQMRSSFKKLGARAYLVISIASVAINLALDAQGRIAALRIAVGACAAAPQRLTALEARLLGQVPSAALAGSVSASDLAALSPIDDVRASAAYRRDAALVLVRRALSGLLSSPLEVAA
jgi:CO/xanthine dehydrogenase FAD-binding subunit